MCDPELPLDIAACVELSKSEISERLALKNSQSSNNLFVNYPMRP